MPSLLCIHIHLFSSDLRNVSVKLPCVYFCLSSGDLLIFLVSFPSGPLYIRVDIPKKRCKDSHQLLGIRNWRLMADRRKGWRRKLGEARVDLGCNSTSIDWFFSIFLSIKDEEEEEEERLRSVVERLTNFFSIFCVEIRDV